MEEELLDFTAPAKGTSRQRNWFFTINNPTDDDKKQLHELPLTWMVYQFEKGNKNGTPHFQGCFCLNAQLRFNALKTLLPRARLERTRDIPAAIEYCMKADTHVDGPWTVGRVPKPGQDKRNEMVECYDTIKSGVSFREVADMHPSVALRYAHNVQHLITINTPPRDFITRVFIFWGDTGTGKTRDALYKFSNVKKVAAVHKGVMWFDTYDPLEHETVVVDDFYGGIRWTELLQLCDRHQHLVQVKGNMVQFRAKTIIFTSNTRPESWYPKMVADGRFDAFKRRLEEYGGVVYYRKRLDNGLTEKYLELGRFPDEIRPKSPDVSDNSESLEEVYSQPSQ